MTSASVIHPVPGLDVSELLGQPLARRHAGQRAELPGQVGLVEVPAVGGEAGQPRPRPSPPRRAASRLTSSFLARSNRMTRAAAFGVRPISARNRLARWRPLHPVSAARSATRTAPPARSSCRQDHSRPRGPPVRGAGPRGPPASCRSRISSSTANRSGQPGAARTRCWISAQTPPRTASAGTSRPASWPAGRPSSARPPAASAPAGCRTGRPSWVISAGAVCRPPSRVSYLPGGCLGSGWASM